ncbi:DUF2255 family protein [Microbacterium sp. B35-04]|uniref:DUF2255 family protein n=1 Tax=Microbacterium sp. B35-04 TaxID=1961716 RepID=UPI0019535334|nr:DUF2255 family protein [Microbacterium sp. B35-04]
MPDRAPSDIGSGSSWSSGQLRALSEAIEIEVSASRRDGGLSRWTPIWVVVDGADVFVRTWHRRDTGWYGGAVRSAAARIRVGDASIDVIVAATGSTHAAAVDAAYRKKYGDLAARSMVTAEAAASTLRLTPRAD